MKNSTAKKSIAQYYILSLLPTLPFLIPMWLIKDSFWEMVYLVCFLIYMRIVIRAAVRTTIMPSLWKELDAEKYAAIINTRPFWVHYSYKLNLYFAIGDYQSAYNIISSILLQHKNARNRIYGRLLLCRICFERGDYEGLKEHVDEIDHCFQCNPSLKFPKQNKAAYDFYRAFSDADYVSACALLEKGIAKYSKKKSGTYFSLIRQYQLAVTKRMKGDMEEAVALFEMIREKAPKLVLSTLAQKQLDYISGTLEETTPERLEVTELEPVKSRCIVKIMYSIMVFMICICFFFAIASKILLQIDVPKQKNKDLEYVSKIERALYDDYEEYRTLGYFSIYSDEVSVDSVFLVESDGKIDLHTLYRSDDKIGNHLNVKNIQVDKVYVYKDMFSNSKKIEFVLTEKKRDIPEHAQSYYEIDGYYFCVISISDC